MESSAATAQDVGPSRSAKAIEEYFSAVHITPGVIKLFCGATVGTFFGLGIRSALRHTRGPEGAELHNAKVVNAAVFATRALAVATAVTFSGFGLLVIGVSALLNVNTPRQFGDRMKELFGDRFRLEKRKSIATLTEVFRSAEESSSSASHKKSESQ